MSVTNVEQYEKPEAKPARRKFAVPKMLRTLILAAPLLLFGLASLASLGFFIIANTLLGTIAAYVAIGAGVISLIVGFLLVHD